MHNVLPSSLVRIKRTQIHVDTVNQRFSASHIHMYIISFVTKIITNIFFFFSADGSGTIMVRGCALDSGTLTTDTEIIRMSHCGSFYFDEK